MPNPMIRRLFVVLVFICGFALAMAAQESISSAPPQPTSIGLAVGEMAPRFSLRDQNGREVSSDTLKGPKGTVLLFFRSADW